MARARASSAEASPCSIRRLDRGRCADLAVPFRGQAVAGDGSRNEFIELFVNKPVDVTAGADGWAVSGSLIRRLRCPAPAPSRSSRPGRFQGEELPDREQLGPAGFTFERSRTTRRRRRRFRPR